jgi:hypothetical protein
MMYMSPNNALELVKQHQQDLSREAEVDRLLHEAERGSGSGGPSLLAPLHAALTAIARLGRPGVSEEVKVAATVQPSSGPSLARP